MKLGAFSNPDAAYRGVALWMLNDKLEKREIARQLRGFREAGWGAVIARTFVGLLTQYLSDEWMAILKEIVRVARREGLRVWFQAGYMPSAVPDLSADMAHKVVVRKLKGEAPGEDTIHVDGNYAYRAETRPHVVDFLSPKAVSEYLKTAYERPWLRRFGKEFGRTIEALWVDEPHFNPPSLPWSEALPERFERAWGYPLKPQLPALFSPTGNHRSVRHHYWRTVLEMLLEGYFASVRDWCDGRNVKFAGHLMSEDTIQSQIGWTAAVMPCYEYMHLPGIDHLTMSLTWPSGKPFILTPKQCSSSAHQVGREEILSEMYGVSSQGIAFEDRKRIAEWLAVLGINYRCYHGAFYSMRGRRKRTYVPHLSHQQPWWNDNRCIADYFARLSYALRQGTYDADVLVIHPVESGFCLYDPGRIQDPLDREREPAGIRALDDGVVALSKNLLRIHRGFDYGDETILARHGKVVGNELVVGQMTYKAVVLPALWDAGPAIRRPARPPGGVPPARPLRPERSRRAQGGSGWANPAADGVTGRRPGRSRRSLGSWAPLEGRKDLFSPEHAAGCRRRRSTSNPPIRGPAPPVRTPGMLGSSDWQSRGRTSAPGEWSCRRPGVPRSFGLASPRVP
ncbi:MAG: glycosyl hydrolase [Planctomycetota bacterium]|nr:glycosyl hydrolase [Planctomycetota bacterium]